MDFLFTLAVITIAALILGAILNKLHLPALVGMLLIGIILGEHQLNLINSDLMAISPDLRRLALIIILLRAGLGLDLEALRKNGISALLLCFLPALAEIVGYLILGRPLLGLTPVEALILGSVIAAVSPAVVVPRMLRLKEEHIGEKQGIPDMIMAGASCDDIFTIVLFTSFITLAEGGSFNPVSLLEIPLSIITGVIVGVLVGYAFMLFIKRVHIRDSIKVLILLSLSIFFVTAEDILTLPYSGLLSVIAMGALLREKHTECAIRLSGKFSKLWIAAEILLFTLVGAEVDIAYALDNSLMIILLLFICLIFRLAGVFLSTLPSKLNMKERLFTSIAYSPKATVQAAIGAIPLSMGLECGSIVLTTAVLAILITAPIGAFAIDISYKKLLD